MERHTTELDVVLGAALQYNLRGRRNRIYTQTHLPTHEHAMKDLGVSAAIVWLLNTIKRFVTRVSWTCCRATLRSGPSRTWT